jgi:exo-1,4-beta-D-glucosaminidase
MKERLLTCIVCPRGCALTVTLDESGKPVRPSFYTDNFFSLLPGESKEVVIDTALEDMSKEATFVVKGWNIEKMCYKLNITK